MINKKRAVDGGLQSERTSLSWSRTIFVLLLDALLVVRVGYANQNSLVFYAGMTLVALTLLFYFVTVYRAPQLLLEGELTTSNAIWMKRIISLLLGVAALLIALSCGMSLYHQFY